MSICALLSGASHVVGTDLDENAIDAAHENAQVNGITSEQYKVLIGNLIDDQAIKGLRLAMKHMMLSLPIFWQMLLCAAGSCRSSCKAWRYLYHIWNH